MYTNRKNKGMYIRVLFCRACVGSFHCARLTLPSIFVVVLLIPPP